MECLLILGLSSEIYRHPARARIFLQDKFIDEFEIIQYWQDLEKIRDEVRASNHSNMTSGDKDLLLLESHNNLRIYKINAPEHDTDISIEIKNDINNYTNGFMSRFTKVKLDYVLVFPCKLLKHSARLGNAWQRKYKTLTSTDLKRMKTFYVHDRPYLMANMIDDVTYTTRQQTHRGIGNYSFGESGVYKLKLIKKHNIFWTQKINGYCSCKFTNLINWYTNKYKQHENQGNTN